MKSINLCLLLCAATVSFALRSIDAHEDAVNKKCFSVMEHIKHEEHHGPVTGFADGKSQQLSPECLSPCCASFKLDDTLYYTGCSKFLCDCYRRNAEGEESCGAGACLGACGVSVGCNQNDCACLSMLTALWINCMCLGGPDHENGCLGCGVSCGQCSIKDADKNSLGCFLGLAKQNIHFVKQQISFKAHKFFKACCCAAFSEENQE